MEGSSVHSSLPYGRGSVGIEIPSANLVSVLEGRVTPSHPLPDLFSRAWEDPIGIPDPRSIFSPGEKTVFIVNDHTRPTPTGEILELIWERIEGRVSPEDVTILVATGIHRPPRDDELDSILGGMRDRFRVVIHDCDSDLVEVGESSRGNPILLNRLVVEAEHVVSIGHIGMHYYAGYSGGRKNILPGVAGRETIEANHARMISPRSEGCVYSGNPVSEEMVEAAGMVNLDFIVDVIFGSDEGVAKVVVGEAEAAHAEGRAFWDERFQVPLEGPADLVIASVGGHPKDIDLYQAYKGAYNAMRAVREGGMVVLVAACPDGVGNATFTDWIMRSRSPADVLEIFNEEGFRLGGHKAVYLARDLNRASIHLYSEMDDRLVERFFLTPIKDLQDVIRIARDRFGDGFRALVMPHAADTFPVLSGG